MKEQYITKNFHSSSIDKIAMANTILEEYQGQGLTLTVRQLYYQFVARGYIDNTQREYKKIVNMVNDARLAGLLDWALIEDRTRQLRQEASWSSGKKAMATFSRWFALDKWENQPFYLEVWIEKDALVGVIEDVCNNHQVPYFACRGYASQSELYKAGKRLKRKAGQGKIPLVLHLGDHDPSGVDMTADNRKRLTLFSELNGIEVHRLALNYSQIEQYAPPPNPVKFTDSRAQGYQEEYGNTCWELDALEPPVIVQLLQNKFDQYIDPELFEEKNELEAAIKEWFVDNAHLLPK